MKFEQYLQQLQFSQSTISTYCYLADKFLMYKDYEETQEIEVNYNDILKYIKYLKRNNNDKSVNLHLIALRHFFNYKNVEYNPVRVHVKRKPTLISTNGYSTEQLHQIYDEWTVSSPTSIRDKVLLGLFVFQGIQSHEVKSITVDDIDLDKLTIDIKQSSNSNQRVLPLHVKQVLLIDRYVNVIRNELLSNREDDTFIITSKHKNSIRSILNQLNLKLPKLTYHPNLRLIRTSVIKNWLKVHDLRKTQYLAGHRYISSTERYVTKDLQHLKNKVIEFHPL